jgi:hypothetical protein
MVSTATVEALRKQWEDTVAAAEDAQREAMEERLAAAAENVRTWHKRRRPI